MNKLTEEEEEEEINKELKSRNIIILDNNKDEKGRIKFGCLVDGCCNKWITTIYSVVGKQKSGCAVCAGQVKLTNEIIDEKLKGRNIKRLGNCKGARTPIDWICLICDYGWETAPSGVIGKRKSGCKNCAGSVKLTNSDIDKKLEGRNIKRLSDYKSAHLLMKFECLIEYCNYKWETTSNSVIGCGKTGCPKCAGQVKLTNENVDERLIGRNIKRLEDCKNSIIKIGWQCLIDGCGYIWRTTPSSIISSMHTGCPKCSNRMPITNEIIDEKLIGRNIKRLENCISGKKKILFGCLIENCNYKWKTTAGSVIGKNNSGCPKCAGKSSLTDEMIDEILKGRNIKRLDNTVNNKTKIEWQCLLESCNYVWKTTPNKVVGNTETGCPLCACIGQNEKLMFGILKENNVDVEYQYGIKNINPKERALKFDFYFTKQKTAIEYNGKQHYEIFSFSSDKSKNEENFEYQQERDRYKKEFCKRNNINLIEIDGRKYKSTKLKNYVINTIIPLIK